MSNTKKIVKVRKFETYLYEVFGFHEFRENQRQVIEAIVKKKQDVSCLMATGHGKSICYQLPAIILGRPAVVISPLLSLMEDQRVNLEKIGIETCCYHSESDKSKLAENILNGQYKIIYITPESVIHCKNLLQELNNLHGLSVLAIDESHCVSLWGNSFRSSYLQLSCLKEWLPKIPILAMTGTATQKVDEDIVNLLKLNNPLRIRSNPDRPNLSYFVHKKTDPVSDLQPIISTQSTIIYCQTKKQTEKIAQVVTGLGLKCEAYHAGFCHSVRNNIHHDFLDGTITCIVATISFGMGIDKSDIRKVIHYGCPKDIESYCQETGRAGRDGQASQCHIYFSESDFDTNRHFIKNIDDVSLKKHKEQMIGAIEKYLYTNNCRRKFLLSYFGINEISDNIPNIAENGYQPNSETVCCDNCLNAHKNTPVDVTEQAKVFLELLECFSAKFGKSKLINAIRGIKEKKMPPCLLSHHNFGSGSSHTQEWWKICLQHLINQELVGLKETNNTFGSVVQIKPAGLTWLKQSNSKLIIDWPNLSESLSKNMGKKNHNSKINSSGQSSILSPTVIQTYDLLNDGLTITEIMKKRQLSLSTIETHISQILESDQPLKVNQFGLADDKLNEIISIINEQLNGDISKLSNVKTKCRPEITYFEIKCAIAIFKKKIKTEG